MNSVRFTLRFVNKIDRLQTIVLEPRTGQYRLPPGTSLDIAVEGQPVSPLETEIDNDWIYDHCVRIGWRGIDRVPRRSRTTIGAQFAP